MFSLNYTFEKEKKIKLLCNRNEISTKSLHLPSEQIWIVVIEIIFCSHIEFYFYFLGKKNLSRRLLLPFYINVCAKSLIFMNESNYRVPPSIRIFMLLLKAKIAENEKYIV